MKPIVTFGVLIAVISIVLRSKADNIAPEACNLCKCSTKDGFVTVNCTDLNLSMVPESIPDQTSYLDLRQNPLICDCQLAMSIKRLTSSRDINVIGQCKTGDLLLVMEIHKLDPMTLCPDEISGVSGKSRVTRSVDNIRCPPNSPNCAYIICNGVKHWLPMTTDWGCCHGVIHDLTLSYCVLNGGDTMCSQDDFRCDNRHCISQYWRCNHGNDCQDGSDEVNCTGCPSDGLTFRCKNSRCIERHRVCDAYNDCGDGSDETNCRLTFLIGWCGVNEFLCANENCVSINVLCDGNNDCGDGSDEQGCLNGQSTKCPSGWSHNNTSCYKLFSSYSTWSDSLQTCLTFNAHLTKITSQSEKEFIKNLVLPYSNNTGQYWIGLNNNSNQYKWSDGSYLTGYASWDIHEPSYTAGQCVVLGNSNMKWKAQNCASKNQFLCSKDATCRLPCQNGGSCGMSGCLCTAGWTGEDCSYKPPVIDMPSYQDLSLQYNTNVSFSCQSTGIPRPHINWLINKQPALQTKVPYVSNITVNVRNTIELECTSRNRGGLSITTIRIVVEDNDDDDVTNIKTTIRLTDIDYTDSLKDQSSVEYQDLATKVVQAVSSVYTGNQGFRGVGIVQFRAGSVICDLILQFNTQEQERLTEMLRDTVQKGSIAYITVDKQYLVTQENIKVCPYDFFNVTWSITLTSSIRVQRCPYNALGKATRRCSEEGKWEAPDYRECVTKSIMELQTQMNAVLNKTIPSPEKVQEILTLLVQESSQPQTKMAGDMKMTTLILTEVVQYNEELSGGVENNTRNIKNFILVASNLLDAQNNEEMKLLQKYDNTTTILISALDNFGLQAAGSLGSTQMRSKQFVASNLVMGISVLPHTSDIDVMFPDYNDTSMTSSPEWQSEGRSYIILPKSVFKTSSQVRRISNFLYRTLSLFLNISSAYDDVGSNAILGSHIISATVKPIVTSLLDPIVTIHHDIQTPKQSPSCVFWDFDLNARGGGWSRDGCRLTSQDDGKVTCECDHLTNFAVLMSPYELKEHDLPLRIITLVGCGLSLLGLAVTIVVHLIFWRNLKSEKTTIHVNLCVALLMANILLLVGLERTSNKVTCTVIAAILHYLFLSAVAWMLVEGIQIYVAIVMVFQMERKGKYFYLIGWGLPILIVGISMAATQTEGYGTRTACWLSSDKGLLYAFIGPVLAVVLMNTIIFILVVRAMMTTQRMISANEKQKARLSGKCCAVLLPLLGLTWLFGVLALDQNVVVFLYLFAIFNSLQVTQTDIESY